MQYLLSLPPNLVSRFHSLEGKSASSWFVTADPDDSPLGSGGGTAHLLHECWRERGGSTDFQNWLGEDRRILIHAGGKSRRLPAYSPTGKILTPIPVFRWKRGQKIDQKLLDIQIPFYDKILKKAPSSLNTLIASGDILILHEDDPGILPDVDVLVFGTWVEAIQASNHGVFFCHRNKPEELAFILQKPDTGTIQDLVSDYLFMMDAGIWLLSTRALKLLMDCCGWNNSSQKFDNPGSIPAGYDLYGEFSRFLGSVPVGTGSEVNSLTTAVVPLKTGSFYHYGTSLELTGSTYRIQNKVADQREIWHKRVKPHPDIFIMNSVHKGSLDNNNRNLWIENSFIPGNWSFTKDHIFTGIPENQWSVRIPAGISVDMIPVGEEEWCIRPYGMNDDFRGSAGKSSTTWLNEPLAVWFRNRNISFGDAGIDPDSDFYDIPLFPVLKIEETDQEFIQWLISFPGKGTGNSEKWINAVRLSASGINREANLERLYSQRKNFLADVLPAMANNYKRSIFYQLDLDKLADLYNDAGLPPPGKIDRDSSVMNRIHNNMFISRILKKSGKEWKSFEDEAFTLLREGMTSHTGILNRQPVRNTLPDQIVWARSPVRLDLAGGWTDTPPYCIINGGKVMNIAVELNGQPPIQVYITPTGNRYIRIKSIDLGQELQITVYDDLEDYHKPGSGFAIAKAALLLSGFNGNNGSFTSLEKQLQESGGGFDISLLAAVPKGSGLGTSSILAATLLGALSEYCGFSDDNPVLGKKTLILEQMLTTGGGWQDQYGGIFPGMKVIETSPGFNQSPEIRWLPEQLLRNEEYRSCMMLYYTGVTRVAKNILGEIVRQMFLNHRETLDLLAEIRANAGYITEAIRKSSWDDFNRCVEMSWVLNQQLDSGTNPPAVQNILDPVEDLLLSKKLPGAGGGGYLLMIAKDPDAAVRIRKMLNENPPNDRARFVDIRLSGEGLTITKS